MNDDEYDDTFDDQCWNCGGEGFVSDCFEEYACLYPEDGCDLCTRRCDVCNHRPRDSDAAEGGDANAAPVPQDQQARCVSNRPNNPAIPTLSTLKKADVKR